MKESIPVDRDGNQEKETLFTQVEILREKYPITRDLVLAVGRYILERGFSMPSRYIPRTILESRFITAEEAFEKGALSCGAVSTVAAAMLRHVGLQVKLIHGEHSGSVDHAWISVLEPESNTWVSYDLSLNPKDMSTHVEKARVDSWEEIRRQIESDHETLKERVLARRARDKKGSL